MDLRNPELLAALNTATKYPSIPTYHKFGEKGRLTEELNVTFKGAVIGTEKIDGTNTRIILTPGGPYMIGSREELLYAEGDYIHSPNQGIVDVVQGWVEGRQGLIADLEDDFCGEEGLLSKNRPIIVLYGETFGDRRNGQAWKNYTLDGVGGMFRLFDIVTVPRVVLEWDKSTIAAWRDAQKQSWLSYDQFNQAVDILQAKVAPQVFSIAADEFPTTVKDTLEFMKDRLQQSVVARDFDALRRPEGFVVRTPSGSKIAKLRFEDYEKTLR